MNVEDIFIAAVELSSEHERREYVSRMCPDAACVAEVESLLNAHQKAGCFLQAPFVHLPEPDTIDEGPEQFLDRSATKLGRYELTRRLGVGGMGEVYLARDTQLQRDVAVKVLSKIHTRSSAWLRRFFREARIASAVNHPNILTVYEIGQSDEIHFIVTEYIEGMTLRDRLARLPMTLSEILDTASQAAGAIAAAHSASIVHRDLKPENIMIRNDGLVAILEREPPQLHGQKLEFPAELEQIVRKTLLKDRDQRYQSAKELWIDLKKVQQGAGGAVRIWNRADRGNPKTVNR